MTTELSSPLPSYNSMVASAQLVMPQRKLQPKYDTWQEQLWDYYDRLGEFESGISWLSKTMSRVRLVAAELNPGGDEPEPLREGPAADAIMRLAGGTGGQSAMMRDMSIHLSVPGEGWLVGEESVDPEDNDQEDDQAPVWAVKSADEIRVSKRKDAGFEVRVADNQWRPLSPDSLVIRFWKPHPRFSWKANSKAFHAKSSLFELDAVTKRMIAVVMSRLASNGILLYDKGRLSIPGQRNPAEGEQAADPFAEMLVTVASRGIKDPTGPEATIPLPVGYDIDNLQDVDPRLLLQLVDLSSELKDELLRTYDRAVKKVATNLDIPAEILLGIGEVNHWGAWQIEESGIKIHVSPLAELICHALTTGYLIPALKSTGSPLVGPNGGRVVVWYDPSEITVRPDRSSNTISAYDRFEVSGTTLRREIGLGEDDAPDQNELQDMGIKAALRNPQLMLTMLQRLGVEVSGAEPTEQTPESEQDVEDDDDTQDRAGPPDTQEEPPPPPDEVVAAVLNGVPA